MESRDRSLSPKSKERIDHLIKDLKSKKASIKLDERGDISVEYESEMKSVMACKDVSQAEKIVSPKNKKEELAYVESMSEIITGIKNLKSPSGVIFDKDKIFCKNGFYVEEANFEKTGEILGKGVTGSIYVVKDKVKGTEHALKTVMISEYHNNELRMWVDLNDEDFVPSLLLVTRRDNKIHFHMEKLTQVVTLRKVVDELLGEIDSDKIKSVSLCILHGLLTVVDKIHDKDYLHNDLHGGNVMLQKKECTIDIKIIDFGMGQRMEAENQGYERDILSCFRLFTAMYVGLEFNDIFDVKKNGLSKLEEVSEIYELSDEDRKEILQIFDVFLEVVDKKSRKFRETKQLLEKIDQMIIKHKINKAEMLEHAARKLFPDKITPLNSLDLNDHTDSPREGMLPQLVAHGPYLEEGACNSLNQSSRPDLTLDQDEDRITSIGSTGSNYEEVLCEVLNEVSIRPSHATNDADEMKGNGVLRPAINDAEKMEF